MLGYFINTPDMRFITNNWIKEIWQAVNVKLCGKIVEEKWKGNFKDGKLKIDLSKKSIKKMRTAKTKEKTEGRDALIDKGKLTIGFASVVIETPVFVHFEFDNFTPHYLP